MSAPPEDWDQLARRARAALPGAAFNLAETFVSLAERLSKPEKSPYRARLLDEEGYNIWLQRQGGVCAICKAKPVGARLAVDHDHKTMRVRGLLCRQCNTALGSFNDDPSRLRAAVAYLELNQQDPS